jgi:tRNA U34 5-methylaminomethyl-2-thiouridine-forming methyltransferase MnmC
MKLTITTLVIVEDNEVLDIYHSLEDNQEKAYQEIVDMVEDEYGDEETNTHFKSIEDIENYFDIVSIETQELTSIGFKTAITYQ